MYKFIRLLSFILVFTFLLSASQEVKYVGSVKSNKYHYTWCTWANKIKPKNLITFESVKEARNAGYIPCKVCKPPAK